MTKDKARVERVHLDWSSHVAENAGLLPSFLSILIVELVILAIHFVVEDYSFIFFLLLTLITGLAMGVFITEALLHSRRTKLSIQTGQVRT